MSERTLVRVFSYSTSSITPFYELLGYYSEARGTWRGNAILQQGCDLAGITQREYCDRFVQKQHMADHFGADDLELAWKITGMEPLTEMQHAAHCAYSDQLVRMCDEVSV